jgi:hypothetical protein
MHWSKSDKTQQERRMELTQTLTREPGQDAAPSLLDSIETTAYDPLPSDYRKLKTAHYEPELEAAISLYSRIDELEKTEKRIDLENCRHFAWFVRHEMTGQIKVVANACHLRWCPICAGAKRMMIKSAVSKWLRTVKRPKFMTFTLKHSTEELPDQIKRLYKAYRLFRQHKLLKKKQRGGVWFFQLKRSKKTEEWHPHLHVVVDMDYINKVEIQDEWLLVTGDSFVVDIRAIKDAGKVVDYVARYCASPCNLPDYSPDDQDSIYYALSGKRLCGRFGTGNQCHFKPKRPVDFAQWQRLITWTDCVCNRNDDTALRQVIRAWNQETTLDTETAKKISDTYAPSESLKLTILKKPPDPQLFFEEFH